MINNMALNIYHEYLRTKNPNIALRFAAIDNLEYLFDDVKKLDYDITMCGILESVFRGIKTIREAIDFVENCICTWNEWDLKGRTAFKTIQSHIIAKLNEIL